MAKITMTMRPKGGPIILKGITAKMQPRLKKALREVGGTVTKQVKRHLSEVKRATPPGRKYPAFQTGALFRSVTHKAINGPGVKIGPNTAYAAINEFGGKAGKGGKTTIPARPYVFPAWDKLKEKMLKVVSRTVVRR